MGSNTVSDRPPIPPGWQLEPPPQSGPPPVPQGWQLEPQMKSVSVAPQLSNIERLTADMFPGAGPLLMGFKRGTDNFVSGVKQLGASFTGDDEAFQREQAAIAQRDAETKELGGWGQAGSLVGEVAPSVVAPGGPTGGGIIPRVVGGVATDVLTSVADPVREGQTRAGNMQNVAMGSGVMRTAGGFAGKIADRFASAKAGQFKDPEIADLIDSADENEIRIFFDDATQAPLAQKLSVAAEYLGRIGTGRGRALQNDEAYKAALDWVQRFSGDIDDYSSIVQSGLGRKLAVFQKAAAKKYKRVADIIDQKIGGRTYRVKTDNFNSAIDAAIKAEEAKGGRANKQVIQLLNNYKNSPTGDFDKMIEFRSDLLKDIDALYRGESAPNYTSQQALNSVKGALNKDMDEFAAATGADKAWKEANSFYRNTVGQFKEGKLKTLLKPDSAGNFDETSAWKYLSANNARPERARKMWQALDVDGRAAVRAGLLQEALEASTKEGAPFSPAKFASSLEKRMNVANEFFRGQSGEELRGLIKVMRHIERAGQFAENPPTGQRVVPWLMAGGAYFEPSTAATITGFGLTVKGLFQTKTGRNLLLAANQATPGSAEFNRIIEQIERIAARSTDNLEGRQDGNN